MIPHKLQIKNFLSYGADMQTIDFSPYHLIYLSGRNGHGKSALLDAITWAVWGQARKITNAVKPDQGLLRLGQTHMVVIFDFELNGQFYRVKREFIKSHGKAVAQLEFGMLNTQTNELIPLTDKTIRATQEKIETMLRLDYESFVNTAFLRQGHSNEFCQKSPKDRKEILATILGLQQFDLIKRRAQDTIKQALAERQALSVVQDSIAKQLEDATAIEQLAKKTALDLQSVSGQEKEHTQEKETIRKQRANITQKQKTRDLLVFKTQQHQTLFEKKLQELNASVSRWRSVHNKQLRIADYTDLEQQKKTAAAVLASCQQTLQNRLQLQEKILKQQAALQQQQMTIKQKLVQQSQELRVQRERVRYDKQATLKLLEQCDLQVVQYEKQIAAQEKLHAELDKTCWAEQLFCKTMAQFEKRKNVYQQFVVRGNLLRAELDNFKQKQALACDDNPSCPLCDQNLSASRRKFLRNKFSKQQLFTSHQLGRLSRVIKKLKLMLLDQHKDLEQQKQRQAERENIIKTCEQARKMLQEAEKQKKYLIEKNKTLDSNLAVLEKACKKQQTAEQDAVTNDPACKKMSAELHQIEAALRALHYSEKDHKIAQQKMQEVEKQLSEYVQLQHELHNQKERAQAVSVLVAELKLKKKELLADQKELKIYESLDKDECAIVQQEKSFDAQHMLLLEQKEKLIAQQGGLKSKQEQLEKSKKEEAKLKVAIEKLNTTIEDYQIIAAATGKDGIQALLIEEAIPEIEQEANYLLAKLTNNQSQIFIESLRDLKRGGSKETLDINISDPSGIRSYELFSGGEAFRIDFALRIAISKLLARRAGTALQTLIIDEGFGSQDEEGLSSIMDAIYKVQDDFEKVIIVSHLPAMREQFPVHFVVEKGPNGSQVHVVQQG